MRTFGTNLREDCKIDKFNLDEEDAIQSEMYAFWTEGLPAARLEKDRAADRLRQITSQRTLFYKRNPPQDLVGKVTDKLLVDLVNMDTEVLEATEVLRQKEFALNTCYNAMATLEQRRDAIANLVKLHINKYFNNRSNITEGQREEFENSMTSKIEADLKEHSNG